MNRHKKLKVCGKSSSNSELQTASPPKEGKTLGLKICNLGASSKANQYSKSIKKDCLFVQRSIIKKRLLRETYWSLSILPSHLLSCLLATALCFPYSSHLYLPFFPVTLFFLLISSFKYYPNAILEKDPKWKFSDEGGIWDLSLGSLPQSAMPHFSHCTCCILLLIEF